MNTFLDLNNHLFALARYGKRLPHWLVAIILTPLFLLLPGIALAILIYGFGFGAAMRSLTDSTNPLLSASGQVIFLVLMFVPVILLLWAWVAMVERRPFWTMGLERARAIPNYVRGVLVGFVLFAASIGILAMFGSLTLGKGNPQDEGFNALGGVLFVFLGWTVQGPAEELLCRGWLLPTQGARYRPWVGIAISTLTFTMLHSLNTGFNALAVGSLLLFGVFTALYALCEGSLWGVFGIHAAWNWAEGNIFGLQVSGQQTGGGVLLHLRSTGPDWMTGGAFGPEGGLAVMVSLTIGVVILMMLGNKKHFRVMRTSSI